MLQKVQRVKDGTLEPTMHVAEDLEATTLSKLTW